MWVRPVAQTARRSHLAHALPFTRGPLHRKVPRPEPNDARTRPYIGTRGHARRRRSWRRAARRRAARRRAARQRARAARPRGATADGTTAGGVTACGVTASGHDHSCSIVALPRCARLASSQPARRCVQADRGARTQYRGGGVSTWRAQAHAGIVGAPLGPRQQAAGCTFTLLLEARSQVATRRLVGRHAVDRPLGSILNAVQRRREMPVRTQLSGREKIGARRAVLGESCGTRAHLWASLGVPRRICIRRAGVARIRRSGPVGLNFVPRSDPTRIL